MWGRRDWGDGHDRWRRVGCGYEWINGGCRVETFPPLVPKTLKVAFERQRETEETEGGREMTKVEADAYDGEIAKKVTTTKDGNTEDSCPLILETSVVLFENQRETRETGGL